MDTIGILIQCPKDEHIVIEELCINRGIDLTKYFLELHYESNAKIPQTPKEAMIENELAATSTTGMPDKFFKPKTKEKKK